MLCYEMIHTLNSIVLFFFLLERGTPWYAIPMLRYGAIRYAMPHNGFPDVWGNYDCYVVLCYAMMHHRFNNCPRTHAVLCHAMLCTDVICYAMLHQGFPLVWGTYALPC